VVELTSGVAPSDRVIENPPDGIGNGTAVRIAGTSAKATVASQVKHANAKG
jgi:hypothetical protein